MVSRWTVDAPNHHLVGDGGQACLAPMAFNHPLFSVFNWVGFTVRYFTASVSGGGRPRWWSAV